MTDEEAIATARAWVGQRKEVRRRLICVARRLHPIPEDDPYFHIGENNTLRKLYQYPSDLGDERLLILATL